MLASVVLDGGNQESPFIVGSANDDGLPDPTIPATQANWTFYRASGTIPIDAASAVVRLRGAVTEGSLGNGNDGVVDLVSLQVIPEPSTVALLAAIGPLLLLWRLRQARRRQVACGRALA